MIATNLSSVLLNMETWIYQTPHVGYHGKTSRKLFTRCYCFNKEIIVFEAYLTLTMYLFKIKFPFKMFIST